MDSWPGCYSQWLTTVRNTRANVDNECKWTRWGLNKRFPHAGRVSYHYAVRPMRVPSAKQDFVHPTAHGPPLVSIRKQECLKHTQTKFERVRNVGTLH